jgi:hypothetical protein
MLRPDGADLFVGCKLALRGSGLGAGGRRPLPRGQRHGRLLSRRQLKNQTGDIVLLRGRQSAGGFEARSSSSVIPPA